MDCLLLSLKYYANLPLKTKQARVLEFSIDILISAPDLQKDILKKESYVNCLAEW
jgi:hypothetical protein